MTQNPNRDYRSLGDIGYNDIRDRPVGTGPIADKPPVSLYMPDAFYYAPDANELWYTDGFTWQLINFAGGGGAGEPEVIVKVIADQTVITTGDGKTSFNVPVSWDGKHLVAVQAGVAIESSSGNVTVQVHNETTGQDMLSTPITIDAGDTDSSTAATAAVINGAAANVATGDKIRFDVDGAGTAAQGLEVTLNFET